MPGASRGRAARRPLPAAPTPGASRRRAPPRRGVSTRLAVRSTTRVSPVRGAVPRIRRPAVRSGAGRPAVRGAVPPARAGPDVRGVARLTAPRRVGGAAPALPAPAGRAGRARWACAGRARWACAGRARWGARWACAGRARWACAGRARWACAGRARWGARWACAGRARWACAGRAPRCRVRPCSADAPAGTDQMARTRMQSAGARRFMAIPLPPPPGDPLGSRSGSSSVVTSMVRANCRFRPDSEERLPCRQPSAANAAPRCPCQVAGCPVASTVTTAHGDRALDRGPLYHAAETIWRAPAGTRTGAGNSPAALRFCAMVCLLGRP